MSILDVTNLKSKVALTPTKFYDKDDIEIGQICRAWVNFNGIGTVAIRESFNVSSITDNGTGNYTINFTNAMPTSKYAVAGGGQLQEAGIVDNRVPDIGVQRYNANCMNADNIRIVCTEGSVTSWDPWMVTVIIFA